MTKLNVVADNPIKIEKGVPIPKVHEGRKAIYPFDDLGVGESFFVPHTRSLGSSWVLAKQRHPGWKFITRVMDGGRRVWRVQ